MSYTHFEQAIAEAQGFILRFPGCLVNVELHPEGWFQNLSRSGAMPCYQVSVDGVRQIA